MALGVYELARIIQDEVPVGAAREFCASMFEGLTTNPFTREPGLHRLMSNLIGSGFGAWRVTRNFRKHTYTFEHREPTGERVSWDWDRRPPGWSDAGWLRDEF